MPPQWRPVPVPPPPRAEHPEPEVDTPPESASDGPSDASEAPEVTVFDAPPVRTARRVEVSPTLLASLVGALMVSLLTIGFLVGRGSGDATDPAADLVPASEPTAAVPVSEPTVADTRDAASPRDTPLPAPSAGTAGGRWFHGDRPSGGFGPSATSRASHASGHRERRADCSRYGHA